MGKDLIFGGPLFMYLPRRLLSHLLFLLLLFFSITSPLAAQRGARTLPRALDELSRESPTIVHGTIVSARVEPHPQFANLMTVVVRMNVTETLKGQSGRTLEFRQYIWDVRDQLDAAQYRKGQELLLLLGPVSQYGLRSPSGLEQGRFVVSRDSSGKAVAVNGRGNMGLFANTDSNLKARGVKLPAAAARVVQQRSSVSGAIDLADLKTAIRGMEGAK